MLTKIHGVAMTGSGMTETQYDSRPETLAHIEKVASYIRKVRENLRDRAEAHDQSKLVEPELSAFDKATPLLQTLVYGSDEYKQSLKDLGPALEHHLANNSHHPEFWDEGISGMSLMDLVEMICDWKAASERLRKPTPSPPGQTPVPQYNNDFLHSIALNQERFGYTDEMRKVLENTARELGFV